MFLNAFLYVCMFFAFVSTAMTKPLSDMFLGVSAFALCVIALRMGSMEGRK